MSHELLLSAIFSAAICNLPSSPSFFSIRYTLIAIRYTLSAMKKEYTIKFAKKQKKGIYFKVYTFSLIKKVSPTLKYTTVAP